MLIAWPTSRKRDTRWDGDFHIAYQVLGDGPDLLFVPNGTFPIDLLWDEPAVAGPLRRLASFSRLILTDILGAGSSAHVPPDGNPPCSTGPMGYSRCSTRSAARARRSSAMQGMTLPVMLLAASHPERVRSLVVVESVRAVSARCRSRVRRPRVVASRSMSTTSRMRSAPAHSWMCLRRAGPVTRRSGGGGHAVSGLAAALGSRRRLELWMRLDVRHALDGIQAPTLLMRRRGDPDMPREHVLDLAKRIPRRAAGGVRRRRRCVVRRRRGQVLDEIESFVTGVRSVTPSNRVLSTVLFTDIVGSTERAARVGDEAWATTLAAHNRARRATRGGRARNRREVHRRWCAGDIRRSRASDPLRLRDSRRGGGSWLVDSRRLAHRRDRDGRWRHPRHRGPRRRAHHGRSRRRVRCWCLA